MGAHVLRGGLVYESTLDRRHRWEIAGSPEDRERVARCRVCNRTAKVYGSAWIAKEAGRAWSKIPRAVYFGRFLHPDTVERGGKLVIVRHRKLATG